MRPVTQSHHRQVLDAAEVSISRGLPQAYRAGPRGAFVPVWLNGGEATARTTIWPLQAISACMELIDTDGAEHVCLYLCSVCTTPHLDSLGGREDDTTAECLTLIIFVTLKISRLQFKTWR